MTTTLPDHPYWTATGQKVAIITYSIGGSVSRIYTVLRRTKTLVYLSDTLQYRLQTDGTYRQVGDTFGDRMVPADAPEVLTAQAMAAAIHAGYALREHVDSVRRLGGFEDASDEQITEAQRLLDMYAAAVTAYRSQSGEQA